MVKQVRVGIGVYILRDGKILMGKRIGAHGKNTWSPPGGWLEFGESWEECAARETMEEAGIKIKNIRFGTVTNNIAEAEGKHVVTLHMIADFDSDAPKVMDPEKWEKWDWFLWKELPEPLFYPLLELKERNFNPFEI
jgi:8-oxo-dGTP diphosphatase